MSDDRPWTAEEDQMIRMAFVEGLTFNATRRALNALPCNSWPNCRAAGLLKDHEQSLGLYRAGALQESASRFYSGDLRFKRAMIKAVKAGKEHAWFGVIKDRSPIPASFKRYDRGATPVLTQSIAGECVGLGD
jgi:hypothetical protein